MKTTISFTTETITVTTAEILAVYSSPELLQYLAEIDVYSEFCKAQTKTGQARKNERARARKHITELSEAVDFEYKKAKTTVYNEKFALAKRVKIEIEFDGRKKSNLPKIIRGVRMAHRTGWCSPQYRALGLISYAIHI